MSGGRSPKPFFDLPMNSGARPTLRQSGVPQRPAALVEPKGTVRSYLAPEETSETASKPVELSISTLYWVLAGIMVILTGVWSLAYRSGQNDTERRLGSQLAKQQGDPTQLTAGAIPNADNIQQPPVNPEPAATPEKDAPKASSVPSGPGDTYTGSGWVLADPRQEGLNYLHLATLRRDDAVRAVDYLASKGKSAVAVPSRTVDRSPQAAKNPLLFVYLVTPLTREQYRDAAQRSRIENDLRQLGQEWAKSKDKGGVPSDFSKTQWVKYEKN